MSKRHRVKPRRASIAAKIAEELESKWRSVLADERSSRSRQEWEYRERIAHLNAELAWKNGVIARQRAILAHPWRHLARWYFDKLPVTRQKGGD